MLWQRVQLPDTNYYDSCSSSLLQRRYKKYVLLRAVSNILTTSRSGSQYV